MPESISGNPVLKEYLARKLPWDEKLQKEKQSVMVNHTILTVVIVCHRDNGKRKLMSIMWK